MSLLFSSIHCYLDPASGAALCTRELLELLAARGKDCVSDLLMPAVGAPQDVTSQDRRAAGDQILQGAALLGCQLRTVTFQKLVETTPNDLGHGEPRWGHD